MNLTTGCQSADLTDPVQGVPIPLRLFFPAHAAERAERLGPYMFDVALDAPVVGEHLPLVVISHGTGGSSLTHRDLAALLARAGFVVALPEHPGNNRDDNSLAGTAANLENRPRHIRLAIDAVFAHPAIGPRLVPGKVALIGHSLGGYTSLAVAGGQPTAFAHETADGQARLVSVTRDPRVRALVLLAPATPWYMAQGALAAVDVPILMRTGEKDEFAPAGFAEIVKLGVRHPGRIDHKVVPNAGHFSFQSPFPAAMERPDFPPSQDPPGFDRAAFQPVLNREILTFLRDAI